MNKIYILFLIIGTSFSIECHSQNSYVKGYFIDNSNQKTVGLIRNLGWKNNPQEFDFKRTEQSDKETLTIDKVIEFGIDNVSKYIKTSVHIDRSSNSLNLMSSEKKPEFIEEKLFLKVLMEGDASLYSYSDGSLKRYFYQIKNNNIDQLIYKKYKTPETKIGTNNKFRIQLYNDLKCADISMNDAENVDYTKNSLLKFFEKYNVCNGSNYINYEANKKSNLFHLYVRPGLNSSSLSVDSGVSSSRNIDYGNDTNFRIGLEFEFILGFNNNKWAVILEPTYQYFNADQEIPNQSNTAADYKSIEFPLGIRHYLFFDKKSKAFINGSFVYDFPLDSKVRNLDVSSGVNLAFGLGYNYDSTYSVELRYHTSRDILTDYRGFSSNYQTLSVIFGYSIF